MRAIIKPDLMDVIEAFFKEMGDGIVNDGGHRSDPEFIALCDRIAGKEVELVFTAGDAFEKEDNNYWLPACCWDAVPES